MMVNSDLYSYGGFHKYTVSIVVHTWVLYGSYMLHHGNIWGFPSMGVTPIAGWFLMDNHIKMDDD